MSARASALEPTASHRLTVRDLPDSYHVAPLDNDAQTIFAGSLEFVRSHSHAERG